MLTLSEVLLAVDDAESLRVAWSMVEPAAIDGQPADTVVDPDLFDAAGVRYVSAELVERINRLVELVGTAIDAEPAAYRLILAVDDFSRVWVEWAAAVAQSSSGSYDWRSRPDAASVWDSWRRVMEATQPRTYRLVESIDSLTKEEGMSHNQIASIYGFLRVDGSYDVDKVLEEIAAPGSHYNPSTWINPEVARHAAADAAGWARRQAVELDQRHFAADPRTRASSVPLATPAIAPEPIHELLAMDGMTVQQVASMKGLTVEEVTIIRQQLARPASPSDRVEAGASPIEATMSRDRSRSTYQTLTGTLAGDVLAIAAEEPELSPADIAGRILDRWPSASVEIVGAIAAAGRHESPQPRVIPPERGDPTSEGEPDPNSSKRPEAGGGGAALNYIQKFGSDLVSLEEALVTCNKPDILKAAQAEVLIPQVGIKRRGKAQLIEELLSVALHSHRESPDDV